MHMFDLEQHALYYQSVVTRELAHDRQVDEAHRASPGLTPAAVVSAPRHLVQRALKHLPARHSQSPISAFR
jgi:hypothetical protein